MDFEIFAMDNGLLDAALYRLCDWTFRDQCMQTLTLHHQGIVAALNAGLQ
jgi:hypothetical protein